MSYANGGPMPHDRSADSATASSKVEASRTEAEAVAHTTSEAAHDMQHVAQDEAAAVFNEGKDRVRDLYEQTRSELSDEAAKQQRRAATGLEAVGRDLASMAGASASPGVARDLMGEVSHRVNRVATWLGDREPGEVLNEVKQFARKQPGMFIGLAAIAGAVAGRLTRALVSDSTDGEAPRKVSGAHGSAETLPGTAENPAVSAATPRVTEDFSLREGAHDRADTI